MKEINKIHYDNLLEKLNKVEELSNIEAQKEIDIISKIKEQDIYVFYKAIVEWKFNYQQSLGSLYKFAKEQSLYKSISSNDNICKFVINHWEVHDIFGVTTNEILKFVKETIKYLKYQKLYNHSNYIITETNNSHKINFKLPLIQNFEIDIYERLQSDIYSQIEVKNEYKELYDKFYNLNSEQREKNYQETISKMKEVDKLKDEIWSLDMKKNELENTITHTENMNNMLKGYALRMEVSPVNQFNQLYWGDNYPALKVFYDFLLLNHMVDFNWSYFANYMTKGNVDCFNLSFFWTSFNNNDIGYLLYKLGKFIKDDSLKKPGNYKNWVSTKFYINNKVINKTFTNKYIRGFDTDKNGLNNKSEIDNLYENIKKRFI